jgi:hypothetical protein
MRTLIAFIAGALVIAIPVVVWLWKTMKAWDRTWGW